MGWGGKGPSIQNPSLSFWDYCRTSFMCTAIPPDTPLTQHFTTRVFELSSDIIPLYMILNSKTLVVKTIHFRIHFVPFLYRFSLNYYGLFVIVLPCANINFSLFDHLVEKSPIKRLVKNKRQKHHFQYKNNDTTIVKGYKKCMVFLLPAFSN